MTIHVEVITLIVKSKTLTLKSGLCDYSDAYILVNAAITVPNTAPARAAASNTKI